MNTMRRLVIVPLAALSILLLAATCVANVEQKGPQGPWVGEVVNVGDQPVNHVTVRVRLFDVTGRELFSQTGGNAADTCPFILFPGERGAWEYFFEWPGDEQPPVPPLRLEAPSTVDYPGAVGLTDTGLLAEIIERDQDRARLRVRVTNNSGHRYSELTVCGVLRTPDTRVAEVGRASGPAYTGNTEELLLPGEAIELDLLFNSMPEGTVRLHPYGLTRDPSPPCCDPPPPCCMPGPRVYATWRSVRNDEFSVLLPPGWAYEPRQGIDSFVGAFVGDGVELSFDYGIYSDPLNFDEGALYAVHEETIGGVTAKIVRSRDASGTTGVHFADIEKFVFPGDIIPFDVRLTITGQDLTPDEQEIAMQIFRSVRFNP